MYFKVNCFVREVGAIGVFWPTELKFYCSFDAMVKPELINRDVIDQWGHVYEFRNIDIKTIKLISHSTRKPKITILTTANPKTAKSTTYGYFTVGIHLKPSVHNCNWATKGCLRVCLNTAGHGGIGLEKNGTNSVQEARKRKTNFLNLFPDKFYSLLKKEIISAYKKARKLGLKLAIRPNLTSERYDLSKMVYDMVCGLCIDGVFDWENVIIYDYAKKPERWEPFIADSRLEFYHVYSWSEDSSQFFRDPSEAIRSGYNAVSVVFRNKLPKTFLGLPVVDGDKHDILPLHGQNVIIGLLAKGKAKKDVSGFVVDC